MKRLFSTLIMVATLGAAMPALAAGNTASSTATESATVVVPITVATNANLSFGTVIRPSTGSGTVTLSTADARTLTGTNAFWLVSPASTVANFTVSGEGGEAFTLVVDATDTMTNSGAGGGTLVVTTTNNAGCTTACALSGTLGQVANGTLTFAVAGSFPITSTTAAGAYSGTLNVTATYN